jgi:hypothetical protein
MKTLKELVNEGIARPWKWSIFYEYEDYFCKFRNNRSIRVLEFGVYRGESLKLWDAYFSSIDDRKISGIESDQSCPNLIGKMKIYKGDQKDQRLLDSVIKENGSFDIIIDDGSHWPLDQRAAFDYFYPHVNPSGVYIIEDIYSSYHKKWKEKCKNEDLFIPYLKTKIDELNSSWSRAQSWLPETIVFGLEAETKAIHFHSSFVVVEKRSEKLGKHELI